MVRFSVCSPFLVRFGQKWTTKAQNGLWSSDASDTCRDGMSEDTCPLLEGHVSYYDIDTTSGSSGFDGT